MASMRDVRGSLQKTRPTHTAVVPKTIQGELLVKIANLLHIINLSKRPSFCQAMTLAQILRTTKSVLTPKKIPMTARASGCLVSTIPAKKAHCRSFAERYRQRTSRGFKRCVGCGVRPRTTELARTMPIHSYGPLFVVPPH